jgi:hypothetical protein
VDGENFHPTSTGALPANTGSPCSGVPFPAIRVDPRVDHREALQQSSLPPFHARTNNDASATADRGGRTAIGEMGTDLRTRNRMTFK